jgi:hypothetical protein
MGTTQHTTTAFHQQGNGLIERYIQTVSMVIRNYSIDRPQSWDDLLPSVEFALNQAPQDTLDTLSPFEVDLGFLPAVVPDLAPVQKEDRRSMDARSFMAAMDESIVLVRDLLADAQAFMKEQFDRRHRELTFSIGDEVLISTAHLADFQTKFEQRHIGPCTVTKVLPRDSYELELPQRFRRLHPVFHVSRLKRYVPPTAEQRGFSRPGPIAGYRDFYVVDHIVKHKKTSRGILYLIRWNGYSPADDTWEPEANLTNLGEILDAYKKEHSL